MIFLDEFRHLDNVYGIFACIASVVSLWAMQKTTADAYWGTYLGTVKWCHRAAMGLASFFFLFSGFYTVYYDIPPRAVDFILIIVLLSTLILSVMRHMQAPVRTPAEEKRWYAQRHL